jgi:hypothetical protein
MADDEQDIRRVRAAHNEAVFRAVNERIEELAGDYPVTQFVCECSRVDCTDAVALPIPTYERIRSHPSHFFVRPTHVSPDVEQVIEPHDEYVIVEKTGIAQDVAEALDPRSDD